MFIDPRTAIKEGWITFPEWMDDSFRDKCIQPNALDITIDKLFGVDYTTPFMVSEKTRIMRKTSEMSPLEMKRAPEYSAFDGEATWSLQNGHVYDAMSDFRVNVPDGIAAMLVPRSSFNRNGTFIMSGLYDSGFANNVGYMIYNLGGNSLIAQHTRIGQIIFVTSETSDKLYNGIYNKNQGQHWSSVTNIINS